MTPTVRTSASVTALIGAVLALSGCMQTSTSGGAEARPPVAASVAGGDRLGRARVSSQSGEILILEEDGSVTTMDLDSPGGRDAFAVTEADLEALNQNLDLDFAGLVAPNRPREKTAQQKALEAFAARTQPALPVLAEGTEIAPESFIAVQVVPLNRGAGADLVEVTANLQQGVDADIAFSYATCALAGWARDNGNPYGRHVRTLQAERNGKLLIGSAFLLSDSKPMGLRVMETEETLRECDARGIPTA
ncbi:hypothetical protein GBO37_08365 [Paracoccus sp. 08]|nr:hypothetical protein [Paracoccus sp. 08]MCO6362675.1 hypothetical protein [Paracoccus sp. 08]